MPSYLYTRIVSKSNIILFINVLLYVYTYYINVILCSENYICIYNTCYIPTKLKVE